MAAGLDDEKPARDRWQFDLLTACEWVTGVAIICAALAGGGRNEVLITRFQSLPENDRALAAWYEKQSGLYQLKVSRAGNQVQVEYNQPVVAGWFSEDIHPPWEDLGYSGNSMVSRSFEMRVLHLPLGALVAAAAVLGILQWAKKRRALPRKPTKDPSTAAPESTSITDKQAWRSHPPVAAKLI